MDLDVQNFDKVYYRNLIINNTFFKDGDEVIEEDLIKNGIVEFYSHKEGYHIYLEYISKEVGLEWHGARITITNNFIKEGRQRCFRIIFLENDSISSFLNKIDTFFETEGFEIFIEKFDNQKGAFGLDEYNEYEQFIF